MAAALSFLFYLEVSDIYIFGFDGGPIEGDDYFKSEQSDYLGNGGTDIAGVIEDTKKFNKNFSKINYDKFISKILYKNLKAKYIFVSNNFKFGNKREGNVKLLKASQITDLNKFMI